MRNLGLPGGVAVTRQHAVMALLRPVCVRTATHRMSAQAACAGVADAVEYIEVST
jgi:hypothetical protein